MWQYGSWRSAEAGDEAAIRSFSEPLEAFSSSFSYRAFNEHGILARMHGNGGLYLHREHESGGTIDMAVLFTENGTAFPVMATSFDKGGPEAVEIVGQLLHSRTVRSYHPSACLGAADHVAALETGLRWKPELSIEYDAMSLGVVNNLSRTAQFQKPRSGESQNRVEYWRATPEDLESLYPIAAAYERSEVITRLHVFDPAACRASQARSLKRQIVYMATIHSRVVARAQTNARGITHDQIGGVFVDPDFRGMGIGKGIVSALLADIASRGCGAALFVKKTNDIARNLYASIGFKVARDYRVSYFI